MSPAVTVLVVEDESLVRMNIAVELEDAGYQVREAANADAALRIVVEDDVGVLFTDVDVSGSVNGLQLASIIREQFPLMPIIVVSGHMTVVAKQLPSRSELLTKPYLTEQVVAAILRLSR